MAVLVLSPASAANRSNLSLNFFGLFSAKYFNDCALSTLKWRFFTGVGSFNDEVTLFFPAFMLKEGFILMSIEVNYGKISFLNAESNDGIS